MKRVLLLNHDFPPAGGSGVQRVMKFCRYLPEFGWQPTVLSSSCDWQALDDSLLREIPADTEVYRLTYPSHHHAGRWAATAISLLRGLLPAHVVQALSQGLQWRAVQLSRKLLVPDYAALWSLKAIVKAMRLSSRARFDAVLTSGPPHSSHMVGYVLRQCRLTPKWVADFRDPWTSYMGMSPRRGLEYRAGRLLEPEVLRVADAVVTVSAGYAKTLQLSPKDGRKLHLVPNGFDPADIPVDFTRAVAKDCLHIHYNGLLYRPRTPAHFFQALVLCLKDLRPLCPVQATFTGLGEFSSLVGEMDLGETVKDIGRQSHAESLRISRGSGTTVPEVNQLLKRFTEAQKMVKQLQKLGPKGLLKSMGGLGKGMMPFG